MQICQTHWGRLRTAIDERGLSHLIAENGERALCAMSNELEGRVAENTYDPLMGCNWMISSQAMKVCGLGLMAVENNKHLCPICEVVRHVENEWINGPADAALEHCRKEGLVPTPAAEDGAQPSA